jgi:hypothetical protein
MARPLFSVCKRRYSFSRSYHTVRTPPAPGCVVKREQVTGCKYPWPRRSCARPAPVASARLLFNVVATLASRARRFQLAHPAGMPMCCPVHRLAAMCARPWWSPRRRRDHDCGKDCQQDRMLLTVPDVANGDSSERQALHDAVDRERIGWPAFTPSWTPCARSASSAA